MAAQQGFQYEINAAKILKPMGLVPQSFVPAGAGHNQPDLMLQHKKIKSYKITFIFKTTFINI